MSRAGKRGLIRWGFMGLNDDVPRAREAEAGLLRLIFENVRDFALFSLDADGRVTTWNPGAEQMFGWSQEEILGRDCEVLFAPEDRAAGVPRRELEIARETGRAEDDRWHLRKNGTRFFASSVMTPIQGGRLLGYAKICRDITERKRTDEALSLAVVESERRLRLYETILSHTPDFVYVFDLDHRFVYANEILLKLWGRTWDEAIGKTCWELGYEPWHAEMHDREIEQVKAAKAPIRGEVPFSGAFGRRIYEYIFVPVMGEGGEVEAVAGATRDVTERKEMEQELRDADHKKDDFIAMLAHELRNPLAPIRTGLQVLRLSGSDSEAAGRVREMMERQLSHMVRLIDDLLDVSRITRNKMELRRAKVPLAEVVSVAVETARPLVDEVGHELTVSLPATPVMLDADLTRLAQVFANLLINSAKYTPKGGRIWLSAERGAGEVAVSVKDTGIGIPEASLSDLFDLFSQVNRAGVRTAGAGGLGIGLALVKGLVEMHGGTVEAASEGQGLGSTFTVRLPVPSNEPGPTAGERMGALPELHREGRRILVVDDSRDGADAMAQMLRLLGNDVRTAYDGVEAIEQAEQFRPDLVLMDIGMPCMNGLDATRVIRGRDWAKNTTIIALTGWGQDGDRERSREAGCNGHLVKPVGLDDLENLLAQLTPG